ncbi:MAG TPA: hypothetical protein VIB59_01835 [Solirubrobacteraceae bacterium]
MPLAKQMRAYVAALAALAALPAAAGAAPPPPRHSGGESALMQALLHSRVLWATIDVCSPADQPNYVGVRGSMPGDKHPRDKMYMRFRLQYMDTAKSRWVDLASARSPNFVYVGPGSTVRQGGRSFQLVPRPGRPAVSMRGVVEYQWRRGRTVMQSTSRPTSAGHKSIAGADPPGFSSATCLIG